MTDTSGNIVAVATPPGRGGIGIVRVSGPDLTMLMDELLSRRPEPRSARLETFRDAAGEVLDRGLALYFPAPYSYTGEHVLELHCHGNPLLLDTLVARVCELGARPARPGEFTERAFLNGKLDLAQAEAVADLIDASSMQAARGAQRSLQGVFSSRIERIVEQLIRIRTQIEAGLDFPEEDIEPDEAAQIQRRLAAVADELAAVLDGAGRGARLREGLYAVIAGQPNVGKSSLLNRLAQAERAIVTEQPGTTRDAIHEDIFIDGCHIALADTAGIRETEDAVESEGVRRSLSAIGQADLVILVVDDTDAADAAKDIHAMIPATAARIVVHNKIDKSAAVPRTENGAAGEEVWLSAKTGAGMQELTGALLRAAGHGQSGEDVILARRRHLQALELAHAGLAQASARLAEGVAELCAEDLRRAQDALSSITGQFGADDLLGEIFSGFCIGK